MIATSNNKYSWTNEFSIRNNENSKEIDIMIIEINLHVYLQNHFKLRY